MSFNRLKVLPPNKKSKPSEQDIREEEKLRAQGNLKRKIKNIKRKANKEKTKTKENRENYLNDLIARFSPGNAA
mgnify:CR=1 FL=1